MIVVNLDVMLAKRKMSMTELSHRVGITMANLSILKNGKSRAIRLSTLDAVCTVLACQPGELLEWVDESPTAPERQEVPAAPAEKAREPKPAAGRKSAKRRPSEAPSRTVPAAPAAAAEPPARAKRAAEPERKPVRRKPEEMPPSPAPEKRRRSKPAPVLHTIVTGGGRLNLRSEASRSGAVVGILTDGMQVELLETQGQWANVRTGEKQGWVLARYVR